MTRRQLSQPLAFLSKFPTLLFYKMMGITPLVNYFLNQFMLIQVQNYKIFLK